MNSMVYEPTGTELDIRCNVIETVMPEDIYMTTPMTVIHPTYLKPNEEELLSSFEEAISDRVLAVNRQLRRLSVPLTENLSVQFPSRSVVKMQCLSACLASLGQASRLAIRSIAIAFMLVMVGFDLMGLLVLLKSP